MPYKDIFATVYTVTTPDGILLFDAGSFDEDIEEYIVPFFEEVGIKEDMIKYVFISHNHKDHAGGLEEFMKKFPQACIISRSDRLKEKFSDYDVFAPCDGDTVLGVLNVVTIPGHTQDSSAIFDIRTRTMICGDCLQLYGIFGSGKWAANILYPEEHIEAIDKVRKMEIDCILTAHDYHPYGYCYKGKDAVLKALDACVEPLLEIKDLILNHDGLDDEKIADLFNSENRPTLDMHVVTAVRKMLNQEKQGC